MLRTKKPCFSKKELEIIGEKTIIGGSIPKRNTPVSYRENYKAHYYDKNPWFAATASDTTSIMFSGYADNLSRPVKKDCIDCFGIPWKWEDTVGGAISVGGNPLFDDANEWRDKIKMPDIDSWNWEEESKNIPDTNYAVIFTALNGFWFERLISMMDFNNAAIALVDSDQQDAVKDLFGELTNLAIKLVDKYCEYWPTIDAFCIHDDWGSQKAPFFSEETAREMILPYMNELVSHIHAKGRIANLHSCGHVEDRVNLFIEAGFDGWQMQNCNNIYKLYEELGDKIVFEAWPEKFDLNDENAAREAARNYVDRFYNPCKTVLLGYNGSEAIQNKFFMEELYEYSRKKFLK